MADDIKYGDPKFIQSLSWHDYDKRDYLIVKDNQKRSDVMNARAKGTTVYELIDIYGGVDAVTEAFAGNNNGVYGDSTNIPEMANEESYQSMLNDLALKIKEMQEKASTTEKPVESTKTESEDK